MCTAVRSASFGKFIVESPAMKYGLGSRLETDCDAGRVGGRAAVPTLTDVRWLWFLYKEKRFLIFSKAKEMSKNLDFLNLKLQNRISCYNLASSFVFHIYRLYFSFKKRQPLQLKLFALPGTRFPWRRRATNWWCRLNDRELQNRRTAKCELCTQCIRCASSSPDSDPRLRLELSQRPNIRRVRTQEPSPNNL